jgi:hypothetical protein
MLALSSSFKSCIKHLLAPNLKRHEYPDDSAGAIRFFAFLIMQFWISHICQRGGGPISHEFKQLYFGMRPAISLARLNDKGDTKMKTTLSRKTAYLGAGAGLVLFALFGLLPGSLLGGAAGIKLAGLFFGLPLDPGILSRVIVLFSMLVGVVVAGITIVTATATLGWLMGKVLEGSAQEKTSEVA